MASQRGDDNHVPATGGRYVSADHRLGGVIATLEDEIGLERRDQFQRCVFAETRHAVDKRQLRQHGGALILVLYRACFTFQASHRSSLLSPTTSLSQDEAAVFNR